MSCIGSGRCRASRQGGEVENDDIAHALVRFAAARAAC